MLIDTVRETIEKHGLIRPGDHIVLGLSGGPDSVCLFDILRRLSQEYRLTIHPVHVNHMFRPGDAERDQRYAEELCREAGLICRSFVADCAAMARELGMTPEEAGRKARYDAFFQVAKEAGRQAVAETGTQTATEAGVRNATEVGDGNATEDGDGDRPGTVSVRIAVAQNANDQAETILHRILRGTGTDGLAGIAYLRYERGIPVIRPLLDVPRSEIEAYCLERGLHPVTDHTNLEPVYTRNRIRLEILPRLEKINPNIIEGLTRLGRIAAADKEYLWEQAARAMEELEIRPAESPAVEVQGGTGEGRADGVQTAPAAGEVVLDRARLCKMPEAIRRRVVLKCFARIGLESDISEERLRAADSIISRKQAPKTVQFPRGYKLTVASGKVRFHR